jgi:3-ketoacyl-CoA synthase
MQVTFMACCLLLTMVASVYVFSRSKPVYLLDYHCYKPPEEWVHGLETEEL